MFSQYFGKMPITWFILTKHKELVLILQSLPPDPHCYCLDKIIAMNETRGTRPKIRHVQRMGFEDLDKYVDECRLREKA
jgi:hypothetical protein